MQIIRRKMKHIIVCGLVLVAATVYVYTDRPSQNIDSPQIEDVKPKQKLMENKKKILPNDDDHFVFNNNKHAVKTYNDVDKLALETDDTNLASLMKKLDLLQNEINALKLQMKTEQKSFPAVKYRNYKERKRILITGGTGFVGSHLVDSLLLDGHEVIALDNHFTGRKRNIQHWLGHPNFELVHHDIVNPFYMEVDQIYHLASPASPPHYMYNPVKTIKTNVLGTINVLGLARRTKARVLLASTSEVYGDPEVHPQSENYWGNVNPVGPRSCYDEGKRVAESLMVAYHKQEKVDIRIARIFNTFGPRMHMNDGRVVSNFILQALQNQSITIYGNGEQTRSFQYVADLVDGLISLMNSNATVPVNIGNPEEHTIKEFAQIIKNLTNSKSDINYMDEVKDDPRKRRPDIDRAWKLLHWKPKVSMMDGLQKTIEYFRRELEQNRVAVAGQSDSTAHPRPLEYFEAPNTNQQ